MEEYLFKKINSSCIEVGVIGLGYVGLPLVRSITSKNINVVGFDVDKSKVEFLNSGKSYLDTVSNHEIQDILDKSLFEATTDFSLLKNMDVILVCVPTPLSEHREPDLRFVIAAAEEVSKVLDSNKLIILESTTYPGTTSEVVKPILEKGGLKSTKDFYLAYSPEREDPGNKNFNTSTIPKVVGGDGDYAKELACMFYESFLSQSVPVSSLETAEAVKITENVFRAVNIALVNELKVIYNKMGIDIWEVIDAAKTKPFGYMPFYPGPGLGGHCIPIDPFYLTWKARKYGVSTRFIELAGEINTNMPSYVFDMSFKALNDQLNLPIKETRVLIVGVAYKKNINDQRESPAFALMSKFERHGAFVDYFDPYINEIRNLRNYPSLRGKKSIECSIDNLKSYDLIVIITDHDCIDYNSIVRHGKLIIDTRNVLKGFSNNKIIKA